MSSDFLPFSVHLILGHKKMSGGDKIGDYGVQFNSGILCLAKNCFIVTAV
jgi:hypothetical protein